MIDRKFIRILVGNTSADPSKGRVKTRVVCLMDDPNKEVWSKYYDVWR